MDIKLNFINQAGTMTNEAVVIFQKNVAIDYGAPPIAWKVIPLRYIGLGDNYPFRFETGITIGASDNYGNYTSQLPAKNGQAFHVTKTLRGRDELSYKGVYHDPSGVGLYSDLGAGSVHAYIYRSGRLLAKVTHLASGLRAEFKFNSTIWIGVTSKDTVEGQIMDWAAMSDIKTELSLLDVASADIVLTDGDGSYKFSLENVVKA